MICMWLGKAMYKTLQKMKILIVDDESTNLRFMRDILKNDYVLAFARSGEEALQYAEHRPDLILLDIIMPGMDGYAVCENLKSNPNTKDIPIIFITVMDGEKDETKGLELGAVDYIAKPFSSAIVHARIKNHLSLKWHRDELLNANAVLEIKVEALKKAEEQQERQERRAQTIHANRLTTLGEMATGMVHEINQPLAAISLMSTVLKKAFQMKQVCDEDFCDGLEHINNCVKRISRIINHMRIFARQDNPNFELFNVQATIDGSLILLGKQLQIQGVPLCQDSCPMT